MIVQRHFPVVVKGHDSLLEKKAEKNTYLKTRFIGAHKCTKDTVSEDSDR